MDGPSRLDTTVPSLFLADSGDGFGMENNRWKIIRRVGFIRTHDKNVIMSILEYAVLGVIQGVAEWLPVSSEGLIVLAKTSFFGGGTITNLVRQALFLHLGTMLAALLYFRKDVAELAKTLVRYRSSEGDEKAVLNFLIVSGVVSGIIGAGLLIGLVGMEGQIAFTGRLIAIAVGFMLMGTGFLQLKARDAGQRMAGEAGRTDGILAGVAQGMAILPGLSRSGLTVAGLLVRRFDKTEALRMSFLMSIPAVLAGNIFLNLEGIAFSWEAAVGLMSSFALGMVTIHLFLKASKRVNFGYFVLGFGLLTIVAALALM